MLFQKPYRFWRFIGHLAVGLFSSVAIASSNSGITYHGRILNPGGIPILDSNVQFKMQILTPDSQNCVMFQEIQSKDLSSSGGTFSITINDGTGVQTFYGYTLDQILGNRGTFNLSPAICSTGTGTWTPNVSDGRAFIVSFKTSSMASWEQLPSQSINFVPFAIEAKQIAGFPGDTLLRVEDPTTGPSAIRSLTPTEATELLNVVDGTSGKYIQSNGKGASIPSFASNPSSPGAGDLWYDSTNNQIKYYDGTTVQTVGGSSGSAITSGTIGGSTAVNTSGNIQTSGNIVATNVTSVTNSTNNLKIYESTNTNAITVTAPSSLVAGGYNFNLPADPGISGQVLLSGGGGASPMTWGTLTVGSGGTGLSGGLQGGIPYFATSSSMASSAPLTQYGVVIGGGTGAPVTTAAGASGTVLTGQGSANPSFSAAPTLGVNGTTTGQLAFANGAGSGQATTIQPSASTTTAWTLTLPSSGGTSGSYLQTNGSGVTTWADPSSGTTGFYKNGGNSFGAAGSLGTSDSNTLSFKTNNTTAMTIDTSQRVGIGTSSPFALLQVHETADQNITFIANSNGNYAGAAGILAINDANSAYVPLGLYGSTIYLGASVTDSGSLAVNGATNLNAGLMVRGTADGTYAIDAQPPAAGGGAVLGYANNGTVYGILGYNNTYALYGAGQIYASSNITSGAGMYATGFYYTSDRRLKENIQTIENPIDKIMALRGVNFQWKETKQQDMGFIAQEVEQVLPEVMGSRPDKTYGVIRTVKYANIVALAVESIKDLYNKWQGDHRDLASLKAEVEQLKSDNDSKNQQIQALEKRLEKLESQRH
jgi:hypothetical protein